MRKLYMPVHIDFLRKIIAGRSYKEVTRLFNLRFGFSKTEGAVKTVLTKNGIYNNRWRPRFYTAERIRFLQKNFKGRKHKDLAKLFNAEFGTSITKSSICQICKKLGLHNGVIERFSKGHVPFNKGRKGYCAPGSEKGRFKPGHLPINTMPIGSERITADGYVEVKYQEKPGNPSNRWKGKHVLLWEKANGPVPRGCAVIFADGNRFNITLNNLILVSRQELAVLNHMGMLTKNKDINAVAVNIARLKIAAADRKRGTWKQNNNKKLVVIDNNGNRVFIAYDEKRKRYVPARGTKHGVRRLRAALKSRGTLEEAQSDLIVYAQKRGWHRT